MPLAGRLASDKPSHLNHGGRASGPQFLCLASLRRARVRCSQLCSGFVFALGGRPRFLGLALASFFGLGWGGVERRRDKISSSLPAFMPPSFPWVLAMSQPPNDVHPPLDSDNPIFSAVGLVASNWAKLERVADEAIWELLQAEPLYSACATAHIMGFTNRMKCLISLMRMRGVNEDAIEKMNAILFRSYELGNMRNRIVHDPWMQDGETGGPVKYTVYVNNKQTLKFGLESATHTNIINVANEIMALETRLWGLCDGILSTFRETRDGWLVLARYG